MKLLFALLFCLQQDSPQIFQATGKFAPEVIKVKVIEQKPLSPKKLEKSNKRYLAMFTASWCNPCKNWKRTTKAQIEAAGYTVIECEMTDPENKRKYSRKISSYPTFVAVDWDTGEWVSAPMVGAISADTAILHLQGSVRRETQLQIQTAPVHTPPPIQTYFEQPQAVITQPNRYIQWPGYGQIDLETYSRNCNCNMCNSIRLQQQQYRQQMRQYQSTPFQSEVGPDQQGCPVETVEAMLDAIPIESEDTLVDLGCGDGRIVIAAARRGVRCIGVEIDPVRAEVARQNVAASGLSGLITIETGDALDFDMSRATIATTYLYPPLLEKLSPKLKDMRVVASPFHPVPGLKMSQVADVWIAVN